MLIEMCLKHINKIKCKLFGKYVYRRNEVLFTKHTPSYARNSVIHFPFCIRKRSKNSVRAVLRQTVQNSHRGWARGPTRFYRYTDLVQKGTVTSQVSETDV